jgi:hypothetical protein
MKDGPVVPLTLKGPLKSDYYRITGRIRDEKNLPARGCIVQAFDKDPGIYGHADDRLGRAKTDENGAFEIIFDQKAFEDWFEGSPEVYLVVRDQDGKLLINTPEKENNTHRIDFQIKLGKSKVNPLEPDLYADNLLRMISSLKAAFDLESLSRSDVTGVIEVLSRAINSWVLYRDNLARYAGYDGIQVPLHPRREEHDHVIRWDNAVLPIEKDA